MSEYSYSSEDLNAVEDAYLGNGGINFSSGSDDESSDLDAMFADLAQAQDLSGSEEAEGGAKHKKKSRSKSKSKKKSAKRKSKGKKKASKKKAPKRKASKKKASKRKAPKKKASNRKSGGAKADKPKPDYVHYTMVLANGKEVGDYKIKRGNQGPSAAAAKAATRHMKDAKISNASGSFNITIRQTTHGTNHNKKFKYKVEYKKIPAPAAFKKMSGRSHIYKKTVTAA